MTTDRTPLAEALIQQCRLRLDRTHQRIVHCLEQLSDQDIWWRPHEQHNAIGNIVLHLCGNLRQWIVAGLGGVQDVRDRPAEFAQRGDLKRHDLIDTLTQTVAECDATLARLNTDQLLEPRTIQGFSETALSALFSTLPHFEGHAQQIVYITRMRLGEAYRFAWTPENPDQGLSKVL